MLSRLSLALVLLFCGCSAEADLSRELDQARGEKAALDTELAKLREENGRLLDEKAELESAIDQVAKESAEAKVPRLIAEEEVARLNTLVANLKARLAGEENRARESQAFSKRIGDRNQELSDKLDRANERLRAAGLAEVE